MDWPKEYSKTTQAVREAAYKLYKVEAITKTTLLPGQEKIGYHQQPLTTDYYLFLFTNWDNPEYTGYFTCGLHAARGWFDLNGQLPEDIPSYNPLTGEPSGGGSGSGGSKPSNSNWNPQMKRLIRVLQTFICLTDDNNRKIKGEPKTLKILQTLVKASNNAPDTSNIRSVNTTLSKALKDGRHGGATTFTQMVEHFETSLGVSFKKIDVDDFNQEIEATRNKSESYSYPYPASF